MREGEEVRDNRDRTYPGRALPSLPWRRGLMSCGDPLLKGSTTFP